MIGRGLCGADQLMISVDGVVNVTGAGEVVWHVTGRREMSDGRLLLSFRAIRKCVVDARCGSVSGRRSVSDDVTPVFCIVATSQLRWPRWRTRDGLTGKGRSARVAHARGVQRFRQRGSCLFDGCFRSCRTSSGGVGGVKGWWQWRGVLSSLTIPSRTRVSSSW